jgi:N-acetylglucosaminyldiphosphoundecaprenol N-acetyl-beta-D-mannosaminyltransferase
MDHQRPVTNSGRDALGDDLSRDVYCVLGIAIDATEISQVLRNIFTASRRSKPYVMSTPNLNFLITSLTDNEFRESLLHSDLCLPDGMPIVWISRLMGIPIRRRVAGSDVLETLKKAKRAENALGIFFFGSTDDVAKAAARTFNEGSSAVKCVGWICPGFGTIEQLSQKHFIAQINQSGADLLMVSLNARKGQLWLFRNHTRLRVPVRAQLGATINFQAGTVKRAPHAVQKCGLEWIWRILQEPKLWRRYLNDGAIFLWLLICRILPLALSGWVLRRKTKRNDTSFTLEQVETTDAVVVRLSGFATAEEVDRVAVLFRGLLNKGKPLELDLSSTLGMDPRFMGLILMLRTQMRRSGWSGPRFSGVTSTMKSVFRRNGIGFLLDHS